MVENKIRNCKVLVNLAKDPISSHFSGYECIGIYRKELFYRYHCIITLVASRVQVIMEKTVLVQL